MLSSFLGKTKTQESGDAGSASQRRGEAVLDTAEQKVLGLLPPTLGPNP